ncbi:MAG: helix-turn-helix transcriptional regulator [Deltaproteobacteria bacterium]|nr:helix-turn-helix transcriptional regulator [Deltaproteobacteria bacterium]
MATDARASQQAQADRLRHAQGLGRAIATLRERAQLRQGDIPGLSSRQLRRLEQGEFIPRVATLEKLAAAHRTSLAGYLDGLAGLVGQRI